MKKYYSQISIVIYILGLILLGYFSANELLSPSFRYVRPTSPIIFGIGWAVIGGYYLVYDKLSDSAEKWIEGIITGLSISAFLYIADRYYIDREFHQESDWWGNYSWTTVTKRLLLPDGVIYPIIIFLIAWLAIDIWKSKFDNAIMKFVLLIISIISYLVISTSDLSKIIATTVIAIVIAVGYYYLKQINNTQKRISALLYITLSLGVIATTIKHWEFFSRKLLLQEYTIAGLAEVFSDYVIFLLGFLLTLFESGKAETAKSQDNKSFQQITQEPIVENFDITNNQSSISLNPAVALLFLVGTVAVIKSIYLNIKVERKKQATLKN